VSDLYTVFWLYMSRFVRPIHELAASIMDEQLKNKIIADIKLTGFPTELLVAQILKSSGWEIEQNGTYLDYELNKSREIDINARKVFGQYAGKKLIFYVAINLVIEIKKSSKRPWIVFTIPNRKERHSTFKGPGFGQLSHSDNFTTDILTAENLMKNFPRNSESSIGTSFYEAFKGTEEPSKIYEAIMSAIKAAFYIRRQEAAEDILSEDELEEINSMEYNKNSITRLEIYMPLIVFDGLLCHASLDKNNEINLSEVQYIPLSVSHSIKPYSDNFNYYPELIRFDYMTDFLNRIDNWGKSIQRMARKR